jgi:UDP-N-acetylmuramoyl-L-alanyl-D-glutamate--2,6-diaminopimelate ligase
VAPPFPVRMTRLLDEIDVLETSGDLDAVEVLGIEHDSRRVVPGDLFCCLRGVRDDGHDHAGEAVARGAIGLVCDRAVTVTLPRPVVQVRVPPGGGRAAMAQLAATYWGHPARSLLMVGVTGTNGKTTVTHLIAAVLGHAGHPTEVIGTLSGARTTPEATDLQRALAAVRDQHPAEPRPAVAMEVTSHGLAQSRVDGIHFDVAVFTNLSHDHLDFHQSMDAYFAAKASLFTPERTGVAVVNRDDPWGKRLVDRSGVPTVPVSDDQISDVRLEPGRSWFTWRGQQVQIALTGKVNVRNAHLAAEAAVALGVAPEVVAAGLSSAAPVPGRLEIVVPGSGQGSWPGFVVLVDYAHTPAALEAVLLEAQHFASDAGGRTIVVFGCAGDRDRGKRPIMGAVASRLADLAVVTSDNPRHEDPVAIVREVVAGVEPSSSHVVEPDRRSAIDLAIRSARPGDVVVVAGKGHETYQEVGDRRIPFDDREVVLESVARLGSPPAAAPGS